MNSSFLAYADTISQYPSAYLNISISLEGYFVLRLGIIYCYSWIFGVPGTSWYQFYLYVDQPRPAKSCSYLVLFV